MRHHPVCFLCFPSFSLSLPFFPVSLSSVPLSSLNVNFWCQSHRIKEQSLLSASHHFALTFYSFTRKTPSEKKHNNFSMDSSLNKPKCNAATLPSLCICSQIQCPLVNDFFSLSEQPGAAYYHSVFFFQFHFWKKKSHTSSVVIVVLM